MNNFTSGSDTYIHSNAACRDSSHVAKLPAVRTRDMTYRNGYMQDRPAYNISLNDELSE